MFRCRAVNGLKHAHTAGIDVCRCCHSEPSLQLSSDIGDDITEHVVRDDHLKLFRFFQHLHGKGVNKPVCLFDAGVFLANFVEYTLPQVPLVAEHVALVAHRDFREPVCLSPQKNIE